MPFRNIDIYLCLAAFHSSDFCFVSHGTFVIMYSALVLHVFFLMSIISFVLPFLEIKSSVHCFYAVLLSYSSL